MDILSFQSEYDTIISNKDRWYWC